MKYFSTYTNMFIKPYKHFFEKRDNTFSVQNYTKHCDSSQKKKLFGFIHIYIFAELYLNINKK